LHFWYRFVSWLEEVNPYEFRQFLVDNFTPQIIKLVSTCASLLQYPRDIEELPKDRIDDINRVRFSVCDTVEDCCRLLGGDIVLQKVGEKLQEEIQRLSSLPQQEQRLLQWHRIESCLLAIKSASRYIPSDEGQVLPFVMNLVPDLPTSVTYLRSTANHVVAGYASWLASHPDTLRPILPFLAQGLSEPKCASSAALAIKNLCQNCTSSISLGDNVLQLYDGILNAQQQHNNSVLDIKDELEVLEGVCIAVSRQLNDMAKNVTTEQESQTLAETIATYVTKIVGPIGSTLVQYIDPNSTAGPKQAVAEIERLTVVIRCLNLPDPKQGTPTVASRAKLIVDLMTQCWAWLDHLSQKFITDINLAEKLCRLHKHCIRGCGGVLYQPLFEKLRGQLVNNFSRSHLSPYLYAVSIIISEYGRDPSFEQHLFQTFEAMSNSAFEVLRSFDDFRDRPDVVEELLYLAVRMIEFCPQPFVSNQLFHSFLQCAVVGMKQDHRDANRGALHFLECSFGYGKNLQKASSDDAVALACRESLEKAVATEGQQIITNSILALTGELPCYRVACSQGSIAGILYETNFLCPNLLMEWLQSPLQSVQEGAKSMLMDVFRFTDREYFFETIERFAKICDEAQTLGR
jgi:transportin-3